MAVKLEQIRRIAFRTNRPSDWEDVAQDAVVLALSRPRAETSSARQLVADAMRAKWGRGESRRRHALLTAVSIDSLPPGFGVEYEPQTLAELIASIYPTPEELWERWEDELSEDQAEEWRNLPAAERDKRIAASLAALGSSPMGLARPYTPRY